MALLSIIVAVGLWGYLFRPLEVHTCVARGGQIVGLDAPEDVWGAVYCRQPRVGLIKYMINQVVGRPVIGRNPLAGKATREVCPIQPVKKKEAGLFATPLNARALGVGDHDNQL